MRIKEVFTKRRSVYNFREDFQMTTNDFDSILELTRHSPSAYNMQGVRYIVTRDKEKQEKLKEYCYGQHKILSASGVILVLADRDYLSDENIRAIYESSLSLGVMSKEEYALITEQLRTYRNELTEAEALLEIYRNTFINVGLLLSAVTILGFDCCPMHVHNHEKVRALFNIPSNLEIVFMLPVGKGVDTQRPRSYRRRIGELVTYEMFN